MPSAIGNWPYPLAGEPVRDGQAAIQALATQANKRLGTFSVFAINTVAGFDVNGLWYANWSAFSQTWSGLPVAIVTVKQTTIGNDAGVNTQIYHPHNSATTLVVQANYVKDGRNFTGNIDVSIIAIGVEP